MLRANRSLKESASGARELGDVHRASIAKVPSMEWPKKMGAWQGWVSLLLLQATMLNYMDRQTLSSLSPRIKAVFSLTNEQYGEIEMYFGISFAFGSLFFGFIADYVSVRILYPTALLLWSAVGIATGACEGYTSLAICRSLLGFFEAGHWPCALIVTQRILSSGSRVFGNSVLQSGASLGAILTPLIIRGMVGESQAEGVWRTPFYVVGCFGLIWIVLWFLSIPAGSLDRPESQKPNASSTKMTIDADWIGRFLALAIMVISINTTWQIVRAWLPTILQEGRGYSEKTSLYFTSLYYVATDVGCIAAGAIGMFLTARGLSAHRSRVIVYSLCAGLAALTTVAAYLPQGTLLLGTLLLVGAGALGLFPCYYSFTQELSYLHMGKVTGLLSAIGWLASSPMQKLFGRLADKLGSFDMGLLAVGWMPFFGLLGFLILWRQPKEEA